MVACDESSLSYYTACPRGAIVLKPTLFNRLNEDDFALEFGLVVLITSKI